MVTHNAISSELTQAAISCLWYGMEKIEHCLSQLGDQQVWWRPQEEMNSIGNLLLHLSGNLGQWIVAGVGDTEDTRHRPGEFAERRKLPKQEILDALRDTVEKSCSTLSDCTPDSLIDTKRIQGSEVTKMYAMMHSITHFQGHVQEIIGLTRQQLGDKYEFHWTPTTAEEGAESTSVRHH